MRELTRPGRAPAASKPPGLRRAAVHGAPPVAASLAVSAWGTASDAALDLRYAPDEADLLQPHPATIFGQLGVSFEVAEEYPVDDPYRARLGAEAVSAFHGVPIAEEQLNFAAGVTGLLRDLAALGGAAPVLAPELVHPDLEVWAMALGREVLLLDEPVSTPRTMAAIRDVNPGVVHVDRPGFLSTVLGLGDLVAIADAAAERDATVVVDESAAAYLGPAASAVSVVGRTENLVVLRGFTKGYSVGGLRVGYAVSSAGVAASVRDTVVPMQVAGPSLVFALNLLRGGDVFDALRERIVAYRPLVVELLRAHGLEVLDSCSQLPWVIVADPGGEVDVRLLRAGIRGLRAARVPGAPPASISALHLTIPLSPGRMANLRELLAALDP